MNFFFKKTLFSNAFDMLNEKNLCLPSIYEFERTVHNLNHPNLHIGPEGYWKKPHLLLTRKHDFLCFNNLLTQLLFLEQSYQKSMSLPFFSESSKYLSKCT